MCFTYDKFDIVEVANRCGIQFHHKNANTEELKALCPFCDDRSYHLSINPKKERFQCMKCKESGNSVSLMAKMNGISNGEAYKILKENKEDFTPRIIPFTSYPEKPIRSIIDRHNVYYDFLNLLKLDRHHRENLENRGLTFNRIHQFMYKSIPNDDVFRREVLEKLASMHNLEGIPGFYVDELGYTQMYCKSCGGIFVPVCNHEGYIQGLQMRLDVPEGSNENKFRWFSSKNYHNGAGAKSWIHVVGDTNANEACLVEGAMKADVSSVLSNGKLFIAVPGVNAISYLPEVIRTLHITKIYESFDMDKRSNPQVKKALITLRNVLTDTGVAYQGCTWNPKYKGLDDYLCARSRRKQPYLQAA